ncbi:unnamed protein product [Prunus armeniaca]
MVNPFCVCSFDGRVKFPIDLKTFDWSKSQLSLVCERATACNNNSSRLLKIDNLRPKLLISKQAIVNLGEEYLPTLEGFLNGQNCNFFGLNEAEVAGFEDY